MFGHASKIILMQALIERFQGTLQKPPEKNVLYHWRARKADSLRGSVPVFV